VRTAVARAIGAARDAGRLKPEHEPYAALAYLVAAECSRKGISTSDLTRLSSRLEVLLSRLPLGEEATRDDGPATPTSGAGEGVSHPVGLASVVGTGATVGDTALPA
jgi:hypothetical protein